MKRVDSDIPPEPIKTNLRRGCPSPSYLEHTRGDSEPDVRGDNLHTRDPLGNFTSLLRCKRRPIGRILAVQRGQLVTRAIRQCFGGPKVGEEVAISLENIELVGRGFLIVTSEGPGTS